MPLSGRSGTQLGKPSLLPPDTHPNPHADRPDNEEPSGNEQCSHTQELDLENHRDQKGEYHPGDG